MAPNGGRREDHVALKNDENQPGGSEEASKDIRGTGDTKRHDRTAAPHVRVQLHVLLKCRGKVLEIRREKKRGHHDTLLFRHC